MQYLFAVYVETEHLIDSAAADEIINTLAFAAVIPDTVLEMC